ncbi:MAG TPA: MBOAT family O-acyltransferase, partial [Planctomycetota bacterium]|nr:MBOAT family O-acyltransferase [Planctomycetota bacterium]
MDPLSPAFAALVGLAIAADRGLRGAARDAALVAGAIVFFAASAGSWLTVATFTFAAALTLLGFRSLGVGRRATPWIVALAAILVAFKWLAASSTARGTLGLAAVALPLGVSYYVLRAIAALVDGARGGVRDARPLEVAGFLSFLPLLRLGPIERLGPYLRQRRDAVRARAEDVAEGALRIVEGAFKVLVVGEALRVAAEPLSLHLGAIPWERGVSWGSVYAYALYIYFDFSGASDLAIGTARLFGVKVIENFDLPYSRPNLAEFWRAWHVSLSSWLRDYL